jgi:hypothetical protein
MSTPEGGPAPGFAGSGHRAYKFLHRANPRVLGLVRLRPVHNIDII